MWNGENSTITAHSPKNYMYGDNVYLYEQVTVENCAYLIGDLSTYVFSEENKNKNKIVRIFINSPGGETDVAFNIISLMNIGRINGIQFHTIVLGDAGSACSLIACAGDHRIMGEYAVNYIHFGCYTAYVSKNTEIEKVNKNIKVWHDKIKTLYMRFSNGKLNEKLFEKLINDDQTYLTAGECMKFGLADAIVEKDLEERDSVISKEEEDWKEFENWRKSKKKGNK